MKKEKVDILEGNIPKDIMDALLRDHTTQRNIFWATKDYEQWGDGYAESDEITYEKVCDNNKIIPRVLKDRHQQTARSRDMAEVFTPSWVCNAQNNLIDNAWFGCEGVFNVEVEESGVHSWIPTAESIVFPEGKTWKDYVRDNRMEITCGEAPYITSRYDATTGELIPVEKRIGLLDRKLRVINENVHTSGEWLTAAQEAYKSVYGFEWQGDNLLLAREAMLYTFIENYELKFGKRPLAASIKYIAYIVSWNIWQMDGLKGVVPNSCKDTISPSLFGDDIKTPCKGCADGGYYNHTGIYCLIKDWRAKDPQTNKLGKKIRFIDLFK